MVFTEHGILVLSSVLKSNKAIQINIQIMRAFIKMRQLVFENAELRKDEKLKADVDGKFRIVFETLEQLLSVESKPPKKIGYLKEEQNEWGTPAEPAPGTRNS